MKCHCKKTMTSQFATAMASSAKTWNGGVSLSTPDISGKVSGCIGRIKFSYIYMYMKTIYITNSIA